MAARGEPQPVADTGPADGGGALLRIEDLRVHYGGLAALDQVSFAVQQASVCGLIGPNGAGKTTLINVISGLQAPTAGRLLLAGEEVGGLPPERLAARGIARTFQNIRLFGELTVLDNVMLGYHLHQQGTLLETWLRLPRARREERRVAAQARALLDRLRLGHLVAARADSLSYGDQRRVEIARALALEPRLLLLDEPAAGMNAAETEQLAAFLLDLQGAGLTLLVIEHDMDLIMRVCDWLVVLNFGRKIAEGPPARVRETRAVIEAYLGEESSEC